LEQNSLWVCVQIPSLPLFYVNQTQDHTSSLKTRRAPSMLAEVTNPRPELTCKEAVIEGELLGCMPCQPYDLITSSPPLNLWSCHF